MNSRLLQKHVSGPNASLAQAVSVFSVVSRGSHVPNMKERDFSLTTQGSHWLESPYVGVLALAVLILVWGYSWVAAKEGVGQTQPFTFAALRNFSAAILLLLLMLALRRPMKPKAVGLTAALGILQTTGMVGFSMWALQHGGAGKTSVLVYTMPFWLLLMAWVVLGERLRGVQWLAVTLALGGLVAILTPWELHGLASSLLALASGFVWAASAVLVKIIRRRHDVDLLSLTAWQMLFGSVPLVVIAAITFESAPTWSASFIAALAYSVVLSEALGWFLWLHLLRTLPAGTAGIAVMAVPVVGASAAWIQLGERPGAIDAAGMTLIVLALFTLGFQSIAGRRRALPLA
jgi:drug/metabolite transporter (DMT)-like permease